MKTNNVEAGKYSLNLFVVAPARFIHEKEGDYLEKYPSYVDMEQAIDVAKESQHISGKSHCVYQLTSIFTVETKNKYGYY